MELNIEKLQELVIELKVLESSNVFDKVGEYLTNKESVRIVRLQYKEKIDALQRKIMTMLKETF
jgi:uncharacterized protein YjgD (DUF1641 family)